MTIWFIKFKAHDIPSLCAVILIIIGILIYAVSWRGSRPIKQPKVRDSDVRTPVDKTPISRPSADDSTDLDDPITIIKPRVVTEVAETTVKKTAKAAPSAAKR